MVERVAGSAQHDCQMASETGDCQRLSEASRKMSAADARRAQAEAQLGYLKSMPVSTGNADDDFCARLSPESAAWMRQNPQVVTDLKLLQKMLGGHYMAIGTGIETESPVYFAAVEQAIGRRGGGDRSGSSDGRSVT
jgi:hypothetical protein